MIVDGLKGAFDDIDVMVRGFCDPARPAHARHAAHGDGAHLTTVKAQGGETRHPVRLTMEICR